MRDLIIALFDGIVRLLEEPAAAAIIGGIIGSVVGTIGSLFLAMLTATQAAGTAHRDYLRRRHDRFEDALADLAAVIDGWAKEETAVLNDYGHSKPDSEDDGDPERADELRQQITNHINQLRARAPHDDPRAPTSTLHRSIKTLEAKWYESRQARAYMEHVLRSGDPESDDVGTALRDGHLAVDSVEEAVRDLFVANAAYVESR